MNYRAHFTFLVGILSVAIGAACPPAHTATGSEVQTRVSSDLEDGSPVVAHVVVALCDNENQGIVPVPKSLGNGEDAGSNLYWGALYGLRNYFTNKAGWQLVADVKPADDRVLQRIVLRSTVDRHGQSSPIYVVADAWSGAEIRGALSHFLEIAAGRKAEAVELSLDSKSVTLSAGGGSHLVAYVGHNGLMEFSIPSPKPLDGTAPRSALVLACASRDYFRDHLDAAGAHSLLLTTGLMAPEAYTLDAALRRWASGAPTDAVTESAARAYDKFQNCGVTAARRLFWGSP